MFQCFVATGRKTEWVLYIRNAEKIFNWTNKLTHPTYCMHEACRDYEV